MSDRRETSFDRYVSAADGGTGMFNFRRPRRPKPLKEAKREPKPRVCDRCEFLYGEDYKNCDHKDLISGYFT